VSVEAWKSFFDAATVILLFLTFLAGAGVLLTGNVINRRQESKLHQFDKDLTIAKTGLAKQQERAATAEGLIALADQHAEEAKAKAEAFRLDIAKANKAAEDERMARVKLQEHVAWRTIPPAEIARIGSKLSAHQGIRINVGTLAGNEEAVSFSEDIANIIKAAGWTFPGVTPYGNVGVQRTGLRISTTRDAPSRTAAQDLKAELDELGFDPKYDESDKVTEGGGAGIYVFVELRPRMVPVQKSIPIKP